MFKKVLLVVTLLTFINISSIYAVEKAGSRSSQLKTKIEEKIEARENKLIQLREMKQVKHASVAAKLTELKKNLIRKYYQNMSERILAMIGRLEKLISRIESRIAKIEAGGGVVDQSTKDEITKAEELLSESRALLTSSDSMFEDTLISKLPKEAFKISKENIKDIKTNLQEVHRLLVHVIGDIKGLRVGESGNEDKETKPPELPL
jgi:hypothetical protein